MSDKTPNAGDVELARPFVEAFGPQFEREGGIAKRFYFQGFQRALRASHPYWSARDVQRVARILAPFDLLDRFADH